MTEKQNAILAAAKDVLNQWDRCGDYWKSQACKIVSDPIIGEPTNIAIARMLVDVVEQNEQGWRNAEIILKGMSDD